MGTLDWELQGITDFALMSSHAPAPWRRALATPRAQAALALGDIREAYLEVRTGPGDLEPIDLIVRVPSERRASMAEALAGLANPDFRGVQALCNAWQDPKSSLASLSELWLEYDDLLANNTAPSAHFGLVPKRRHLSGEVAPPTAEVCERIRMAAELLGMEGEVIDAFLRRVGSIQLGGLIYVGAMTTRQPMSMKAYVSALRSDLPELLKELGVLPPEPFERTFGALQVEANGRDRVYVDVTLDAHGRVGLGIVFPQQYVSREDDGSRTTLRQRLVDLGLLTENLSAPLGAWSGRDVLPNGSGLGQLVQRFVDVKLVCGEHLTTKAYLGIASYNQLLVGHD